MAHEIEWNGDEVRARVRESTVTGMGWAVEHLLQVSRAQVPIEEATLERSGVASIDDAGLVGAVSYDTPYAVVQHEDLTFRHDPGRKAKYLEDPFNAERDTMLDLIAAAVRRGL